MTNPIPAGSANVSFNVDAEERAFWSKWAFHRLNPLLPNGGPPSAPFWNGRADRSASGKASGVFRMTTPPASYTYKAAAQILGWRSDWRLREDKRQGILKVQFIGHRTAQIKRQELVRYAKQYGYQIAA